MDVENVLSLDEGQWEGNEGEGARATRGVAEQVQVVARYLVRDSSRTAILSMFVLASAAAAMRMRKVEGSGFEKSRSVVGLWLPGGRDGRRKFFSEVYELVVLYTGVPSESSE